VSERQQSLVMLERHIDSYGKGIPYLPNTKVKGKLIVIEGPDASGRSTQITMLTSTRSRWSCCFKHRITEIGANKSRNP
jgi:hypothetical protein